MKKKGFVLLMMVFLLLSVLPASAAERGYLTMLTC